MATLMRAYDVCSLFDELPEGATRTLAMAMREEIVGLATSSTTFSEPCVVELHDIL
jgi:hypothetical protein